ncbi:hypothetical protein NLS1_13630 [Nocardioides sp. LS1]|nr:hypothetical protein NLS1_13630 [Nocardioides sp. LS1]
MSEAWRDGPTVTLSDGRVTLRPWSRDDAPFVSASSADPAIRRYNGAHDRQGRPAPPLSLLEAETAVDRFVLGWQTQATTGKPHGVAFAIADASPVSWWAAVAWMTGPRRTWRRSDTGSQQVRGVAATPLVR